MVTPVAPEVLTSPTQGIRSFDATDATLVYAATSMSNPYELYTSTVRASRAQAISDHNASWLRGKTAAEHQKIEVTSDTLQIDAWVIRPPGLAKGDTAPLLVEMHGGPSAMWGPGEATMWHEFQMLAARGYAIVYANPRGSGGYGLDFKTANFQDWGTGPMNDVLAAADVAAELDWVDAERQVLTGGSYAGYLTAWIVSQTDRFDAAVAQRGVYDLATFFGEGNAWRLVPTHFGGYPWEGAYPGAALDSARPDSLPTPVDSTYFRSDVARGYGLDSLVVDSLRMAPREALLRNSPQTYVRDIRTPLLILHADDDLRTGVIQSELLYKSLKVLGREVEYVRYPNAGHDLSRTGDPQHRIDRLLRIYEFLTRRASVSEEEMASGE
jgi:dipeptidyl aminopeptidase/acylaminoacyl peptidase